MSNEPTLEEMRLANEQRIRDQLDRPMDSEAFLDLLTFANTLQNIVNIRETADTKPSWCTEEGLSLARQFADKVVSETVDTRVDREQTTMEESLDILLQEFLDHQGITAPEDLHRHFGQALGILQGREIQKHTINESRPNDTADQPRATP